MKTLWTSALLVAALFLSLAGSPVAAQQTAKVVAVCGAAGYTAGGTNYVTIDVNGNQCGSQSGGSGSSPTNPSYVAQYEPAYQLLGVKGGAGGTVTGLAVGPVYGANYIYRLIGTTTAGCITTLQVLDADGVTWTGVVNTQFASFTGTIAGNVLTVSAVASGVVAINQTISGAGVTSGSVITSLGTGAGGTGTYNLNFTQTVASEAIVVNGAINTVTIGSSQGSTTANSRVLVSGCSGTPALWASLS